MPTLAQDERVYLDLDKYSCKAGDTVWFKGYITQGTHLSSISTNLYVGVYTDGGRLLSRQMFPVYHGMSMGQVVFRDTLSTENYYVVAFTRRQMGQDPIRLFTIPVFVYNRAKLSKAYHKKWVPDQGGNLIGDMKGVLWNTGYRDGKLISSLRMDDTIGPRHFTLIQLLHADSLLNADVLLDSIHPEKYIVLPVDTVRDIQALYLYEDSSLLGRQFLPHVRSPENVIIRTDTLDTSPGGYNSWEIRMPDTTQLYYASIMVSEADRSLPAPVTLSVLHAPYMEDRSRSAGPTDSSYIRLTGKVTREYGKKLKADWPHEIIVMGTRDSIILFNKVLNVGMDGRFLLDSLFFFDSLALKFQLNRMDDGRSKDVALHLDGLSFPSIDPDLLQNGWEDDSLHVERKDTVYTKEEVQSLDVTKMKTLKAVVVRGRKDIRKVLDDAYTSGAFSEPALYSYDLRNYMGEYNRTIIGYINAQGGRLHVNAHWTGLEDMAGHPVRYYVDEQQYDSQYLAMVDFDRIAYIKILESDFLPTFGSRGMGMGKTPVNVLIYTRKGKDFRTMRGGLNTLVVKGYDPVLSFTSDKVTLLWEPWEVGNRFRIRFTNHESGKRFRVRISGITVDGRIVTEERIIE